MKIDTILSDAIILIAEKTEEITQLRDSLDNLSATLWDLQENNTDLVDRLIQMESLELSYTELLAKYNGFLQEVKDGKSTVAALQAEVESTTKNYKQVVNESQRFTNEIAQLKESLNYQKETIRLAKIEMDKLRAEKVNDEHLARKLIELNDKNVKLEEEILNHPSYDVIDGLKQQIKYLKEQEADACQIMTKAMSENPLQKKIDQLHLQYTELKDAYSAYVKYKTSEIGNHVATHNQLMSENESLRASLSIIRKERDELKKDNESFLKTNRQLGIDNQDLLARIRQLQLSCEYLKSCVCIMYNGLHDIKSAGIFSRKTVVKAAIDQIDEYREKTPSSSKVFA